MNKMSESEEIAYEQYLIYVEGYAPSVVIDSKEYEDELLLEKIADYKGGYPDEYILTN